MTTHNVDITRAELGDAQGDIGGEAIAHKCAEGYTFIMARGSSIYLKSDSMYRVCGTFATLEADLGLKNLGRALARGLQ